ncbi:hypothetical protein EAG_03675 [Camponotus floridanus]|uniref:Uncharacterized protein n=1 Tax=Camponotus floridanus TaxID=104421 RepID=E2AVD7_CAMFO|nr:hypothetical protein EAG_03675 [Camponotus floridanus]
MNDLDLFRSIVDCKMNNGSSDEGELTSGATGGGGSNESAEMEENGSTRTSSNSNNNNPVYRDPRTLQAHEVSQDYNQQSRTAYQQRGYSPGMDRQRNYEKEHQSLTSSREEERKLSWDYSEKNARKEYSRSRDHSNEYQDMKQEIKQEMKQESKDHSSREWVSPIPEVEVGGSAPGGPYVRARKDIPRGARFGPYLGKWAGEPFNPRYAWERPATTCYARQKRFPSLDSRKLIAYWSRERKGGRGCDRYDSAATLAHVALTKYLIRKY